MQNKVVSTRNGAPRRSGFNRGLRVLTLSAMMAAMSVVLAYLAKLIFGTGPLRVTFENLPIIFSGMAFGPVVGAAVAVVADLSSCLMAGQTPFPLITVAAASVGVVSGVLGRWVLRSRRFWAVLLVECSAQLVGSVILKTIALYTFGYHWALLVWRLPVYVGIAAVEAFLLFALWHNKQIARHLDGLMPQKGGKRGAKTMTYDEALDYIHSVSWKGSRPGLARITALMHALGDPQDGLRFVHVAGTNGKGSVSAMTESVLRAAGYHTGLFVSPYIKRFTERICFDGQPISERDLADFTSRVRPFADAMTDAPTEFELITAVGLLYFKEKGCDVVVLEVGMGGRLDSTNIIKDPLLCIITGIALDHCAVLGDTVEQIAAEKAGIIKPGAPVVWGGHDRAARAVIEAKAREAGAPFYAAEDTPATDVETTISGTLLSVGTHKDVFIPLLGLYQPQNLSTVLCAVDRLRERGLDLPEEAVREGLSKVRWPGRFEKLCDDPLIISDGAHNPEGIAAAARSIAHYFPGQKVLLLTAVMADKDYNGMVKTLAPLAAAVFTLTPDNPRALPAADYAAAFRAEGVEATPFDTVPAAVSAAVAAARESGLPLFSLGSLYMYAEVTDALEKSGVIR